MGHVSGMRDQPPQIEMTLEGDFVTPPKPPFLNRVLIWAIAIAAIAGALSLAAFALWVALLILPVAVGAAVIAYAVCRYQLWRARQAMGRGREVWRG